MDATPTGVLLFCRADPDEAAAPARLLRERGVLAPAGAGWSLLVPEGRPWRDGSEPVERIATGWATALAVGGPWPVVALWWDRERAGHTLAYGFRRPVDYTWLADGTPAGEDEAVLTLAERLGLDPVLDVRDLQALTRPDPDADARARLLGLLAVLSRLGLEPPPGVRPGETAERLLAAARARPGARDVPGRDPCDAVRAGPAAGLDGPEAAARILRAVAALQLAAGPPLLVWSLTRRAPAPGWAAAGALLTVQGALGLGLARRARGRRAVP
ncbi:hypothetical protein LUX12_07240 [Streptomyces somaliensis]|uniref:hypothetical protein n=1 Tax=Streptomyces somaliensis TaxID=78355 RepID=UPI0020CDD938|nr:hypothetical protein [Streptomyces somaliensis]MCP9944621.1 hypothetical protein [Streptomyces somaliensis]